MPLALRPTGRRPRRWRPLVLGWLVACGAGCQTVDPTRADLAAVAAPPTGLRTSAPVAVHVHAPPTVRLTQFVTLEPEAAATAEPAERAIDLGAALRLAGVGNPTINLAQERVREALAGQLAARVLLAPTVNVGGSLRVHRGTTLDDTGVLRVPNADSVYLGAGAGPVGAGTVPVPGVWLFAPLGDAVYEPLAARQRTAGRTADAQAVRNSVLLDVATTYLALVGAESRLGILRRAEADVAEIVRVTAAFADSGVGARSDANRAAANAGLVRRQAHEAEGTAVAAAARLARLLNLDPTTALRTPGGPVEPLWLVPETSDTEALVAAAHGARPELVARSAAIQEAQTRGRQERVRPWLPTISAGVSSGGFGGGSNLVADRFSSLGGRTDFDVLAVWTLQNAGAGNRARVRRADAGVGQSVAGYDAARNQVRREVVEAVAAVRTAAGQMEAAKAALAAAEDGYRLEADRVRQGQGRPIEALDSFRQVTDARLEALRAVVAFDVAQFQLFVALGRTPAAGESAAR